MSEGEKLIVKSESLDLACNFSLRKARADALQFWEMRFDLALLGNICQGR